MNEKIFRWIIIGVLLVSFIAIGLLWSDRSTVGEPNAGVRDELRIALERNSDLEAELLRSEEDRERLERINTDLNTLQQQTRRELDRSNYYIFQLESQSGISDESVGRIEGLIERGCELVERGRSYLQEEGN